MTSAFRRLGIALALLVLASGAAFSQGAEPASGFGFNMDLGIGVQTFYEGSPAVPVSYQSLGFTPDISFGPFGVGLAVTINYRFTGAGSSFEIRRADWVPDNPTFQNVLALYLPKIMYVRWGQKGDPVYAKLGSFDDATLGDGFLMGEYDNTLFLPSERHFGLQAGLDGSLFNFPVVGVETVIGNLAAFDVLGARVYVRPLAMTQIPIFNALEVGVSAAVDTQPYFGTVSAGATEPVAGYGLDARLPLVNVPNIVSLMAYADVASVAGTTFGGMLGVGGRLINLVTYGLQFRVLGENFIPDYFGPTYDLIRDVQYKLVTGQTAGFPGTVGWLASIGTSLLDEKIVFRVSLDGPFTASTVSPTSPEALLAYPHLRGILSLAEGVIPGITFDFSYDKKGIDTFAALVDPTNAAIQAQFNFTSGPAVISFIYKISYDANLSPDPWTVTSGLQSSIALF